MPDPRLYLVTDRRQTGGRPLAEVVEECLAAGLRAVQLREKDLPGAEFLALAHSLREVTRRVGARLFINGRLDVALAVGADGLQRGHDAPPLPVLRSRAPDLPIGASVHGVDEAGAAERDGADFIVFGPVYDTPSKRAYGPPQGVDALANVVKAVSVRVFAIGGITADRVAAVRAAGAHGVAVISAILGAGRPAEATKAFIEALGSA
ncbi:MAG: thiamine-phosphate diphosphorylase [Candidatus Rokubacteria bacterium RIFCSPLOWO2_02_FULL_68_19]|nr:MAG: thiamine-phosphate diphosphorylase [Candidatus Rokubacteria bacterium RIFCSPLOWO2_02_FULL_68_19]